MYTNYAIDELTYKDRKQHKITHKETAHKIKRLFHKQFSFFDHSKINTFNDMKNKTVDTFTDQEAIVRTDKAIKRNISRS